MGKEKVKESIEVSRDMCAEVFDVPEIREKNDDGTDVKCPTLAYAHIKIECWYGDLELRGFRVLRGMDGNPFVTRPGRTKQLYDSKGKPVTKQRWNDIRIDGKRDEEFEEVFKEKILAVFKGHKS